MVAGEDDQSFNADIQSLDKDSLIFFLSMLGNDFKELKKLIQIKIDML